MATGKVRFLKVGVEVASVQLDDDSLFFLYWDGVLTTGPPSAFDSILFSQWIAMLRDALAHGLEVQVTAQNEGSSLIRNVRVLAP